ncbi:MAG: hypothetical protein AABY53_08480 [Bdellovibrionota bacterium]
MKIKNLFFFNKLIAFFIKFLIPIKPIKDEAVLNLLNEKIKKFGLTPSKIGFLRGKSEIKGLSQIIVVGDVRVKNEIVIVIFEKLFHEISDLELEAHLAIAIAESQYAYQARYNSINAMPPLLIFLNLTILPVTYPYIIAKHFILFNLVFYIFVWASFFTLDRLKKIGTYVTTIRSFNIKLEMLVLLKDDYIKRAAEFPIFVPILTWFKFMSPKQIQKLKKIVEDETEIDFLYMVKAFFKNPIILMNILAIIGAVIISPTRPSFKKNTDGTIGYVIQDLSSKDNFRVIVQLPAETPEKYTHDYGSRAAGEECVERGFQFFDVGKLAPSAFEGFCFTDSTRKSLTITFQMNGLASSPQRFIIEGLNSKKNTQLQVNDEVLSIANEIPTSIAHVKSLVFIASSNKRTSLPVKVMRQGKEVTVTEPIVDLKNGAFGESYLEDLRSLH